MNKNDFLKQLNYIKDGLDIVYCELHNSSVTDDNAWAWSLFKDKISSFNYLIKTLENKKIFFKDNY